MPNIAEIFSTKNVLDYVNARTAQTHLGETLFPSRKVQSLEFDVLKAGSKIPTIASVHAFNTEAEIASREASRSAQKLAFIKRKIQLDEEDLIALRNPRTTEEQSYLEQQVYNDVFEMVEAVRARVEKMRMDVLANGQVTLNENGLDTVVDYHVPSENKVTGGIDPSTDIITMIGDWADNLDEAPTRILTSKSVRNAILRNETIQALFKQTGVLPTVGGLNNILQQMDLPVIAVYDTKYRRQNADGTYTKERYFPENKLVMFGDGLLGESVYGVTPEESRLVAGSAKETHKVGEVYAEVYESSQDPVGTFTKAAATALPSFPEAEHVVQAEIQIDTTEGA